jgi:hypothetical protein
MLAFFTFWGRTAYANQVAVGGANALRVSVGDGNLMRESAHDLLGQWGHGILDIVPGAL